MKLSVRVLYKTYQYVLVSDLYETVCSVMNDPQIKKEVIDALIRVSIYKDFIKSDLVFDNIVSAIVDDDKQIQDIAIKGVNWIYKQDKVQLLQTSILAPLMQNLGAVTSM